MGYVTHIAYPRQIVHGICPGRKYLTKEVTYENTQEAIPRFLSGIVLGLDLVGH